MLNSAESDRLRIVLVSTRNPLNIGAAARAMQNFGFHRMRLVNPYDAAFREARSAVGASDLLAKAEEFTSVADAVADCTLVVGTTAVGHRRLNHTLKNLRDAVPLILQALCNGGNEKRQVAILFGSEKFGLSNQALSHCHWLLHIPTGEEQPSMNLGQAVAVCLYELVRDTNDLRTAENFAIASGADLERFTAGLLGILETSGYFTINSSPDKQLAVRQMVHRLNLSTEDATTWLGMLRQIAWKLKTRD